MGGRDYTYAERNRRARERKKIKDAIAAERIEIAERLITAFGRWEAASTPQEKRAARRWIRIYISSFGIAAQPPEWRKIRKCRGAVIV